MSHNQVRADLSFVESLTSNLFDGLHEARTEVTQAIGSAVIAGETVARACFGLARLALNRTDAIGASLLAEAERACQMLIGMARRARDEVPGGMADMASAVVAGRPAQETISPRPTA